MQAGRGRSRLAVARAIGGRLLATLCVALLTALPLFAQTTASGLVGVVVDSAGTAISGAQIRVVRPALDGADPTPLASDVVTDGAGRFEVRALTPGPVMFSVEHPQYEFSVTEADLAAGVTVSLRITLRVREVLPDAEPVVEPVGEPVSSTIRGVTSDSSGVPVPDVEVTVVGSEVTVRSDSLGRFVVPIPSTPAIYLRARRLGYSAGFARADLAVGAITEIVMRPLGQQLGKVTVRATKQSRLAAGMDQRKALHGGVQLRAGDIERLNAHRISDLLLFQGQSATVRVRRGPGTEGTPVGRRGCPMPVVLNGVVFTGISVDQLLGPRDVYAIEAYSDEINTPSEILALFPQPSVCGVLVVWTR
jgi:hypothetical protein